MQAGIRLQLSYRAPITVLTTHSDLYKAIDLSARRARKDRSTLDQQV
jgi:hypothetical protein